MTLQRLGLFTRLVRGTADQNPDQLYRNAQEQIALAENLGVDTVWVAQHHVDPEEGGLPAPLVFLAHVAATHRKIGLGTAIVALALEDPLRVAEDASVLDVLSGGRLQLGFGSGGGARALEVFGIDAGDRSRAYSDKLATASAALAGGDLASGARLYPPAGGLVNRLWHATFSEAGAERAGAAGAGLLLSRTQPRAEGAPGATIGGVQRPLVDAYRAALPAGTVGRIGVSRSVFVADDPQLAADSARAGATRFLDRLVREGITGLGSTVGDLLRDSIVGSPEQVTEALRADEVLADATDLIVQVHPIDPEQHHVLRSIELLATEVAPALGWPGQKERNDV